MSQSPFSVQSTRDATSHDGGTTFGFKSRDWYHTLGSLPKEDRLVTDGQHLAGTKFLVQWMPVVYWELAGDLMAWVASDGELGPRIVRWGGALDG